MLDKWDPLVCCSYFSKNNEHISSQGVHTLVGGEVGNDKTYMHSWDSFLQRKATWRRQHFRELLGERGGRKEQVGRRAWLELYRTCSRNISSDNVFLALGL